MTTNAFDTDSMRSATRNGGSDHGFVQWLPYLLSRLGPFTASPTMKRLINRPESTIDLAGAMRDRKIVLFNLSKSVLQRKRHGR